MGRRRAMNGRRGDRRRRLAVEAQEQHHRGRSGDQQGDECGGREGPLPQRHKGHEGHDEYAARDGTDDRHRPLGLFRHQSVSPLRSVVIHPISGFTAFRKFCLAPRGEDAGLLDPAVPRDASPEVQRLFQGRDFGLRPARDLRERGDAGSDQLLLELRVRRPSVFFRSSGATLPGLRAADLLLLDLAGGGRLRRRLRGLGLRRGRTLARARGRGAAPRSRRCASPCRRSHRQLDRGVVLRPPRVVFRERGQPRQRFGRVSARSAVPAPAPGPQPVRR